MLEFEGLEKQVGANEFVKAVKKRMINMYERHENEKNSENISVKYLQQNVKSI